MFPQTNIRMNRSEFLKLAFGASAGLVAFQSLGFAPVQAEGPFKLAPLPYDAGALEPHIDKMTMEIHHDKHHKAYVDNLNKAVAGTDMAKMDIDALVKSVSSTTPPAVRNNAGGAPKGALAEAINKKYTSFDNFKTEWGKAATGRFGSGWVWLIKNGNDVEIVSTPNQDNPLMALAEKKGTPVMGLDVW